MGSRRFRVAIPVYMFVEFEVGEDELTVDLSECSSREETEYTISEDPLCAKRVREVYSGARGEIASPRHIVLSYGGSDSVNWDKVTVVEVSDDPA